MDGIQTPREREFDFCLILNKRGWGENYFASAFSN
jgi:hypothetical protein